MYLSKEIFSGNKRYFGVCIIMPHCCKKYVNYHYGNRKFTKKKDSEGHAALEIIRKFYMIGRDKDKPDEKIIMDKHFSYVRPNAAKIMKPDDGDNDAYTNYFERELGLITDRMEKSLKGLVFKQTSIVSNPNSFGILADQSLKDVNTHYTLLSPKFFYLNFL